MGADKTDALSEHKFKRELNSFPAYFSRNMVLGLGAESLSRCFDLVRSNPLKDDKIVDTLSLKNFDYFNVLSGATAEKVDDHVSDAAPTVDTTIQEIPNPGTEAGDPEAASWFDWAKEQSAPLTDRVSNLGVSEYVTENKEWLAVTGSIIALASTANWLSSKKVKNAYLRNITSMAVGVGATWLGAYALGYGLDLNKASDIGLRVLSYHGVMSKIGTPLSHRVFEKAYLAADFLGKPMAFPSPKKKTD